MVQTTRTINGQAYHLTFHDEFDTLNEWWGFGSGGTWATSFSPHLDDTRYLTTNGESQYYVDPSMTEFDVFSVNNGILSIQADELDATQQALADGQDYASGLLSTEMTFSSEGGYFEMRAEIPDQQGFLSSFWLLPDDGDWSSEIDIFEILGGSADTLNTNYWIDGVSHEQAIYLAGLGTGFHTYGLHWTDSEISWLVDGVTVRTVSTSLTEDMFMAISLAVDTTWTGPTDGTTDFNDAFQIDYVRVYEQTGGANSNDPITPGTNKLKNKGIGTDGDDVLYGTRWSDTMDGGLGDDMVYGRKGDDQLTGGAGDDELLGRKDDDVLIADDGSDSLVGGTGADMLEGGAGIDHLWGGNYGGADGETDQFVFASGGGKDFVHDFEVGTDLVDVSAMGTDWATIQPLLQDQGWATYLNFGSITGSWADMVFLKDVTAADLTAADFFFGAGV